MSETTVTDSAKPRKKRRWLRWSIELLIIVAIIMGIRAWQQRSLVDGVAPDFALEAVDGQLVQLVDYQGQPALLHFWATWCPMCEIEQGGISKITKNWPVITVAYQSGQKEEVQRYIEREGLENWTVIVDDQGALAQQYGVQGVPTNYILDQNGHIRFREVGLSSSWGLRFRLWLASKLADDKQTP